MTSVYNPFGIMSPMEINIIFQYFYFARWHYILTSLFHLTTHAYLSLRSLLECPLLYIALDNVLALQVCFQFFSYKMILHANMLLPIMVREMLDKYYKTLDVEHDDCCLLLFTTYVLH